jgi:hypothetical protein
MHKILMVIGLLAAGGFITSLAEYFKKYNLIDLIVEKVKKLFGKAEGDVKAVVAKVEKKL